MGNMSSTVHQAPAVATASKREGYKVTTAMQRRVDWVPARGMAFRCIEDFEAQLDVYMYVRGLRYKKLGAGYGGPHVVHFYCPNCKNGEGGLVLLGFQQPPNRSTNPWNVTYVRECKCLAHTPWPWVDQLKEKGSAALENQIVGAAEDWKLLANVCFPGGYKCMGGSEDGVGWTVVCRRQGCRGKITMAATNKRNYTGERPLRIGNVVDCCQQCKDKACEWIDTLTAGGKQKEPPTCPLCYKENLQFWVRMPCKKEICIGCLENLVHSCPDEIKRVEDVVVFRPGEDPKHYYTCPFCRVPYYPTTELTMCIGSGDEQNNQACAAVPMEETIEVPVQVESMVKAPYAYQSFDDSAGRKASVTREEFDIVVEEYKQYLEKERQQAAGNSTGDVTVGLDEIDNSDFGRLRALRQTGQFAQHATDMLNFLHACEFLHDGGLDDGFLRQVAAADGPGARYVLMRAAYMGGWSRIGGDRAIVDSDMVALLLRRGLMEVIDLVEDDDSVGTSSTRGPRYTRRYINLDQFDDEDDDSVDPRTIGTHTIAFSPARSIGRHWI